MLVRPLIVNATAIGCRVDGIAVYGVNLVKALWRTDAERPFAVVLNEDARRFFPKSAVPAGASIRWVNARMSPSRGTQPVRPPSRMICVQPEQATHALRGSILPVCIRSFTESG